MSSFFRPSIGLFFVVAVFLSLFWEQNSFLDGAQICRLLENGKQIELQHGVQLTDTLTRAPTPWKWVNLTWGSSLATWELYKWGGYPAVVLFYHTLLAATFFFVYLTFIRSGVRVITAVSFSTLIFIFFHLRFLAFTYLFSYAFLSFLICVYRSRRMPQGLDWFCLPLMFLAWGNLDHGWVCGAFFILISLFGRWVDLPWLPKQQAPLETNEPELSTGPTSDQEVQKEPSPAEERPEMKEIRLWLRLDFICILCAFVNPFVWLMGNPLLFWAEATRVAWFAEDVPNFAGPTRPAVAILIIIISMLVCRFIPNRPPASCEYALPLLFFLELSLKGQEQTWLLVIVAAVPLAETLDCLLDRFVGSQELFNCCERLLAKWQSQARGDLLWALVLCAVISIAWLRSHASAVLSPNGHLMSPGLLTFLQNHRNHLQRPLTSYETGSGVNWFLDGVKVPLDDRRDIFQPEYSGPVGRILSLGSGWSLMIPKGDFDSAVISSEYPLNKALGTVDGWKQVYQDQGVTVFFYDPPAAIKK